jgi:hypothetical protein
MYRRSPIVCEVEVFPSMRSPRTSQKLQAFPPIEVLRPATGQIQISHKNFRQAGIPAHPTCPPCHRPDFHTKASGIPVIDRITHQNPVTQPPSVTVPAFPAVRRLSCVRSTTCCHCIRQRISSRVLICAFPNWLEIQDGKFRADSVLPADVRSQSASVSA